MQNMSRGKLLKLLFKKFKWPLLILFLLTFLVSYLSFLIRFNLRTNLYYWNYRGQFYYLFGKYPVIKEITSKGSIYVNWTKLLLILFLLYFPIKIIFQFALNYFQRYYERKMKVYLTKNLLNLAAKNKDLIVHKTSEKVYILNNTVPEFCWQFFAIPINLLDIFVDLSLEIFSFVFLIQTSNLTELVPLILVFLLVNLVWLTFFYFLTWKLRKSNEQKKWNYQQEEKTQIRIFLENLSFTNNKVANLGKLHNLLDNNSARMAWFTFLTTLYQLPNFIIPGITILFLFLYYHFWLGGVGGLDWNAYFVAQNLQRILSETKRTFCWLPQIPDFRKNYRQIEGFVSASI